MDSTCEHTLHTHYITFRCACNVGAACLIVRLSEELNLQATSLYTTERLSSNIGSLVNLTIKQAAPVLQVLLLAK